jgi:DNA-binding transcriptional ArsR family regulator
VSSACKVKSMKPQESTCHRWGREGRCRRDAAGSAGKAVAVAPTVPMRRAHFLGTGGVLDDLDVIATIRDRELPPSAFPTPTTIVLDLGGTRPTAGVLRELIVSLGQRIRGGVYGDARLVIAAPAEADLEIINLLAQQYDFPLFLAASSRVEDVEEARPAGTLTTAEMETLDDLRSTGGSLTASALSSAVGIGVTAMSNRLSNLERNGYLYRVKRGGRTGDLYVDPRVDPSPLIMSGAASEDVQPMRSALLAAGIDGDPYDRSRLVLEGEAAERAAEILRRRRGRR